MIVSSDLPRINDIVPGDIGDGRYPVLLRAAKENKEKPSLWYVVKSKCQRFLEYSDFVVRQNSLTSMPSFFKDCDTFTRRAYTLNDNIPG